MANCFHCGLPVLAAGGHRALVCDGLREFCCAGCEAVARTIVAGGFEKYYETRTQQAPLPQELPDAAEKYPDDATEAALILERVRCSACLWLIERVLERVPGVSRADVNYATRRAQVTWDPREAKLSQIIAAIRAVGYDACPYDARRQAELERRERRAALWRLFIAGFGAMQVMMYAFPAYVSGEDLAPEAAQLMRWASLFLTAPVLLFACRPFFAGAWQELRGRRIGLETPIALGLAGGFAASAWATAMGGGEVYFDSISMLAFLLLGARYAEAAARRRAARGLDHLLKWVSERKISAGDSITVAPGERVPADGVVQSGVSCTDESLLTGESRPVAKRAGERLVGGSVNLDQPLVMRVTRTGADTQAAGLARLAERAAAAKPKLVETADRVARHLTHAVILTALIAGLYWGNAWIAVAVLVVTCPCALGLAAPIVLTRANGSLLGRGALVTRSSALETLERVSDVVLDKTGTLTEGRLAISRVVPLGSLDEPACLDLARSLEASSRHPIARAFAGRGSSRVEAPRHVPGLGIEAMIGGRPVRIGSRRFCQALCAGAPAAEGSVYLSDLHGWLAAFQLEDEMRPGGSALVAGLHARGIRIHLASGDEAGLVAAVARRLGIRRFAGGMTPHDKLDYVERLQRRGRVVAMIGDGLNDAPVLARADVSFAMGAGADAAQLQADVVLTGNSFGAVLETFGVARRAMRLVRQNLAWAAAYNAVALPLAAIGWIGPWEAALGMGASSLIVMLNALRPVRPGETWKAFTFSSPSRSLSYS